MKESEQIYVPVAFCCWLVREMNGDPDKIAMYLLMSICKENNESSWSVLELIYGEEFTIELPMFNRAAEKVIEIWREAEAKKKKLRK